MSKQKIIDDLQMSGLTPEDMAVRELDMPERAACKIPPHIDGYAIPYYDIHGKPVPFYRAKLFNYEVKYKQVKDTPNHVYFPPRFMQLCKKEKQNEKQKYIIFTEGEKKAARAVAAGFPCIAFGGVDSWRNRIILLPKGTELSAYSYNKQLTGAKLPNSSFDVGTMAVEPIAAGFEELANFIRANNFNVIIIYDTDEVIGASGGKFEVQRAASELGFELRRRGIPTTRIRQANLPSIEGMSKTGLDDFLTVLPDGKVRLEKLIKETIDKRSAFPLHPNMENDLNKKLQNAKLSRKDIQKLSLGLITDLDAKGIRMYSEEEGMLYYFEEKNNKLIKVELESVKQTANNPFAKLLYRNYGLSMNSDIRLIKWLSTQFSGEDPVEEVRPFRVLARQELKEDTVRLQIGDGRYVKVSADPKNPIEILHNGSENILFESGQVGEIDPVELMVEYEKRTQEDLEMWWEDVLQEVRLKNHGKTATILALLYYISPWLLRWRGSQLPVELVIGEAGSGKSSLMELRMSILTGLPNLRNAPNELKDYYASIVSTGGLHVTDNIQLLDKHARAQLSNEVCRLVTDPNPHIEMRQLYTNADLMSRRVDTVFAFTAVMQPFTAPDLLQRSVIVELDKMASKEDTEELTYDSTWSQDQLDKFGGRTAWVSHHLYVLHRFFRLAEKKWNKNYQAKHRLINLEQTIMLMAELFGIDNTWIPEFLSSQVDESVVDSDWTLEGIVQFAKFLCEGTNQEVTQFALQIGVSAKGLLSKQFTTSDVAAWAAGNEAFMECTNLINARKLGRYLQTHKAMIAQITSIYEGTKKHNKMTYIIKA
jgi:hypothetical protein